MNVYDFDKTIYKNDSTADFFLFCTKRHPVILKLIPSIGAWFLKHYVLKKCTKTQFKEKIFQFVKYIDYEKDIADFWVKNKKKIKRFYLENQKEDDVIISASPLFVLEPICKELGIKHLLCSKVDIKTGKYDGINCHGTEKVRRYREVFGDTSVQEFYSDSRSDTPLAEISEKPFLVKGNKIKPW
ncbi:MAG: haloacid dehalogenase-like hydrolase [Ruminococcus sp.]|nr:haloacid dehalogenase-like hydrolase [Ruminococcus sp.]